MSKCSVCGYGLRRIITQKEELTEQQKKEIKNIHGIEEIPENIYFFNYYCNKCNIRFFPLKYSI